MTAAAANSSATNATFEFEALHYAKNYRAALISEFAPFLQGRIIEIGAGIGQMTTSLIELPHAEEVLSVEPDPFLAESFRRRLPEQNLLEGTIEDVPRAKSWNAIVSINVLEHIEHDEQELRTYAQVLSSSRGYLCLFVPARPEIYAPLDKDFGHFRRYTKRELRTKLVTAGLEVVRLDYYNWIGYFAWWFAFCVLKKRHFSPSGVKLFDQLVFPPSSWLERQILRPPFGQSLIAVARSKAK